MTDPRADDVAEAERLLTEASDQGAVRLPTLSRAELWVLCGDQQVLMDEAEARWWVAMAEPEREQLAAAMLDLLVDRGLLRRPEPSSALAAPADHSVAGAGWAGPGWAGLDSPDSDWAGPALPDPDWAAPAPQQLPMAPPLALVMAAMQAPAVIAVATDEDGSPEGAPRMFGLASGDGPPRAVVAEVISDKPSEPFGRLHHFSLLSVRRSGHALATWATEASRGRLAALRYRKGPARVVDIYRYSVDQKLSRDHVVISPGNSGTHEITMQNLSGETQPAMICDTEALANLLTALLRGDSL